jgi:hypothetical protein
MTLSVPIHPETEACLRRLAEQAGKDLASYVAELIEGAAARDKDNGVDASGDFDTALDELFAADTRKLPTVPLTYSRDDIYHDHD